MTALEFKHVDLGSRILSIKSGKGGKDQTVILNLVRLERNFVLLGLWNLAA